MQSQKLKSLGAYINLRKECVLRKRNQELFGAGEVSWNRHLGKRFMYDIQRKGSKGNILVFFLQDTLKTAFQKGI